MTVAMNPKHYADAGGLVGRTTGTRVDGYGDVKVGNAQAWYYPDDRVLVLWECILESFVRDVPLRKDTNMVHLWTRFEQWLLKRYPEAEQIVTPWMDPLWQPKDYEAFLRKRGYKRGEPGTYTKMRRSSVRH